MYTWHRVQVGLFWIALIVSCAETINAGHWWAAPFAMAVAFVAMDVATTVLNTLLGDFFEGYRESFDKAVEDYKEE